MAKTVERGLPLGPWVLVVGMHRSGTSALTGALGRLGLALPAAGDLVAGRYDNPVHYESKALNDLDDAILAAAGGSWSAPPPLGPDWQDTAAVLEVSRRAGRRPGVPFPLRARWHGRTPGCASSCRCGGACSPRPRRRSSCGALLRPWLGRCRRDRAFHSASGSPCGSATPVTRWRDWPATGPTCCATRIFSADPAGALRPLAGWLGAEGRLSIEVDDDVVSGAAQSVTGDLARQDATDDDPLPAVVGDVVETLKTRTGPHDRFAAVAMADAPSWMADVLAQRREYEELYARYMRYVRLRRKIPFLGGSGR